MFGCRIWPASCGLWIPDIFDLLFAVAAVVRFDISNKPPFYCIALYCMQQVTCNSFHFVHFAIYYNMLKNYWSAGKRDIAQRPPPKYATVFRFKQIRFCIILGLDFI